MFGITFPLRSSSSRELFTLIPPFIFLSLLHLHSSLRLFKPSLSNLPIHLHPFSHSSFFVYPYHFTFTSSAVILLKIDACAQPSQHETDLPINQSTKSSIKQIQAKWINDQINQWSNKSTIKQINDQTNHWSNKSTIKQINDQTNQWSNKNNHQTNQWRKQII